MADAEIVQAVVQCAYFNYLNRVADGVGIGFDDESPLPHPPSPDGRDAVPRPAREAWPRPGLLGLELGSLRPRSAEALGRWRDHALAPRGPLDGRSKQVLAHAAAEAVCDDVYGAADVAPRNERERDLAELARKLTITPWRMSAADLDRLRTHGLLDAALLDAVATVAIQNALSRVRLALAP